MNEFFASMIIFAIAFFSSLLYLAKGKKDNLLSYLLNLNFEYILVGIIIYYLSKYYLTDKYDFLPYLAFLNVLVGMLLGSQFKLSLLKSINYRFYIFLFLIYILHLLFLCTIFSFFSDKYISLSIAFNTTFPFSYILLNKLLKNKKTNTYNNMVLISLYPLFSLLSYTIFFSLKIQYYNLIFTLILVSIIILVITKTMHFNDKRVIYTLNFLIVIIFTGISLSIKLSPLMTGFIAGLLMANIQLGDIFLNTISFIDKFIYIIIFIITGIFLASSFSIFNFNYLLLSILICLSFLIVRKMLAKILFEKLIYKDSDTKINLSNIGIIPAIIIFDLKIMNISNLIIFLVPLIITFIILEIYNFVELKNELSQ
ncbi:hypothetical protein FHQ18_04200 [Deferribacter autotrophicus]|uniref:Uncharacterized protein n=1 Tax=Deferribacter autotrophicus TaxID=500465 RepID=A0A5A8F6D9_9BACT|nr:hypothetical protein [Deferribacter autotrophicus]KAA0258369.1 hypothetical protein FHQ18_04200 [Deferribacter autotrophicus]